MKSTSAFQDVIRIFAADGERIIPLSNVRAVLRKSPRRGITDAPRIAHVYSTPPAVGIELRSGEIVWSDGDTDWYYSGEPTRAGR